MRVHKGEFGLRGETLAKCTNIWKYSTYMDRTEPETHGEGPSFKIVLALTCTETAHVRL